MVTLTSLKKQILLNSEVWTGPDLLGKALPETGSDPVTEGQASIPVNTLTSRTWVRLTFNFEADKGFGYGLILTGTNRSRQTGS